MTPCLSFMINLENVVENFLLQMGLGLFDSLIGPTSSTKAHFRGKNPISIYNLSGHLFL